MAAIEAAAKKHQLAMKNGESNQLQPADRPAHEWYRFVLSCPPHLVRDYVEKFSLAPKAAVLSSAASTSFP